MWGRQDLSHPTVSSQVSFSTETTVQKDPGSNLTDSPAELYHHHIPQLRKDNTEGLTDVEIIT